MDAFNYVDQAESQGGTNIVVGRNGAGKSRFLRKIAEDSQARGINTLIICNTPFDNLGPGRAKKKISAKSGAHLAERMLKAVISGTYRQSKSRASNVGAVLEYCGYSPIVSIACRDVNMQHVETIRTSTPSNGDDAYFVDLLAAARGLNDRTKFPFDLSGGVSERMSNNETYRLLKLEKELKRSGILSSIDIVLYKTSDRTEVDLRSASSGELSLISTLIFLITKIQKQSVIVIDEPENSLHPQWQREYLKRIYDILYLYEPTIYIATHAPLIISGARATNLDVDVMRMDGNGGKVAVESENIEETMWELFGTITPESHYLSDRLVRSIAQLKRGERSLDEVLAQIALMEVAAYDPKQMDVFRAASALSTRLAGEIERG